MKKGPFLANSLKKKIEKAKSSEKKTVIKTWSRASTVFPEAIGLSFAVHNGHKFIPVYVTESMVGHKYGEFSPTRRFGGHTSGDKKAKK